MGERLLCIDIPTEGSTKFNNIRNRVEKRNPKNGGLLVYHQNRWSSLRGGESMFLKEMVKRLVDCEYVYIDGIYPEAVNAAVRVTNEEAERLIMEGFNISVDYRINE